MTRHIENRVNSISLYELRTNDKAKFYQILRVEYSISYHGISGLSSCLITMI